MGVFTWCSVAACAHKLDEAGVGSSAATWNFHVAGSEAKLAWGLPNSDLVGVMMTCERGSGAVLISSDVPSEKARLVLASGRETLALKGAPQPDPYTGGYWMEAQAPLDSAALRRFARTGDLAVKRRFGGREMKTSNAKGDIRRFFAHCAA